MTPDVRVVRGDPDELELAALVAGLAAGASAGAAVAAVADLDEVATAARRRWRDAVHRLGTPLEGGAERTGDDLALEPPLTTPPHRHPMVVIKESVPTPGR